MTSTTSSKVDIRISYMGDSEFCKIDLAELTKESFLKDVASFVRIDNASDIKIFDNFGAHIPMHFLKSVIQKFEGHLFFTLEIRASDANDAEFDGHVVELVKQLKKYFTEKNLKHLVLKAQNGLNLSEREYQQIIREAADEMSEKHGLYPNSTEYTRFAKALDYIFPYSGKYPAALRKRFQNMRQRLKNKEQTPKKSSKLFVAEAHNLQEDIADPDDMVEYDPFTDIELSDAEQS